MRTVDEYSHGEWHDGDGDEQVGDGERHQEVVGHVLQRPLADDRRTHEQVPGTGRRDHRQQPQHVPPHRARTIARLQSSPAQR